MIETDVFVNEVLLRVWASPEQKQMLKKDLRSHIEEALKSGESAKVVISRMGTPEEVAIEFMSQVPLPYSGLWWRLIAFILDMAIIIGITFPCVIFTIPLSQRVPQHPQGLDYLLGATLIGLIIAIVSFAIGVILFYFPILEGRFGQTLGKRLCGLRVLKENGLPIGYKEAFLRRLSLYFDILPLDALFIPFNLKRQRAFDIVAKTIVVREGFLLGKE